MRSRSAYALKTKTNKQQQQQQQQQKLEFPLNVSLHICIHRLVFLSLQFTQLTITNAKCCRRL